MSGTAVVLFVLALAQTTVEPAQLASGPPLKRAICVLVINGREVAEIPVALRDDDVLVPQATLVTASLRWTRADRIEIGGQSYVSLRSLVPVVAYRFDESNAVLRIEAPVESFDANTTITLAGRREQPERPRPSSAFVNYSATMSGEGPARWGTEFGVRTGRLLWHTSLAGRGSAPTSRGTTSATFDDERNLVRWEMGDTVAVSAFAGAAVSIAGLTVSRELGINPEFMPYLPLTMSGGTAVPATADVYVNGQLTGRVNLEPGMFQAEGLRAAGWRRRCARGPA